MAKNEKTVGIRELRDRLSAYLQLVARGHSVTIGNRQRPVARLVPAAPEREAVAVARLAAAGSIQRASGKPGSAGPVKPRKPSRRSTSDIVREERG